jgi:hypothetical protein
VVTSKPPCLTDENSVAAASVALRPIIFKTPTYLGRGRLPRQCPQPFANPVPWFRANGPTMAAGTAHKGNQKSSAMNPQSATPTSIIVHSEGFNPNSLPSLTTYVIMEFPDTNISHCSDC